MASSAYYADITKLVQDLQNAPSRMRVSRERVLDQAASELLTDQLAHVPVDTGKLKSTLHTQSRPGWRRIGTDHGIADYDVYVEFGTRPHDIVAKNGKPLAFVVAGNKVFTQKVRHPGTRPQPFVANSLRRWEEFIGAKMAEAGVEAIING